MWIKVAFTTPDKPEVLKIASALSLTPEAVIGHLLRVWMWVDQQSLNGHALNVTVSHIDHVSRHAGFATAMRDVGWLSGDDGAISFPRFDRHNGETAKKRVLASERQRRKRSRDSHAVDVTKRREEVEKKKDNSHVPPEGEVQTSKAQEASTSTSRRTRLELTELPDKWRAWTAKECPALDPAREFEKFRNDHVAKGSLMAKWDAAWRTWCLRAVEFTAKRGGMSAQAALEARNAAVSWTPPADEVPA